MMRAALHIASVALMLPNLVLASAFLLLGHAIGGRTLLGFFDRLITEAAWMMPWGLIAAGAGIIAMLGGGLFVQTRLVAAIAVAALSMMSVVVLIFLQSGPMSAGQWLFLAPGIVSIAIGAWLIVVEWPGAGTGSPAAA